MKRDFLTLDSLSRAELDEILHLSATLKRELKAGKRQPQPQRWRFQEPFSGIRYPKPRRVSIHSAPILRRTRPISTSSALEEWSSCP